MGFSCEWALPEGDAQPGQDDHDQRTGDVTQPACACCFGRNLKGTLVAGAPEGKWSQEVKVPPGTEHSPVLQIPVLNDTALVHLISTLPAAKASSASALSQGREAQLPLSLGKAVEPE